VRKIGIKYQSKTGISASKRKNQQLHQKENQLPRKKKYYYQLNWGGDGLSKLTTGKISNPFDRRCNHQWWATSNMFAALLEGNVALLYN